MNQQRKRAPKMSGALRDHEIGGEPGSGPGSSSGSDLDVDMIDVGASEEAVVAPGNQPRTSPEAGRGQEIPGETDERRDDLTEPRHGR